MTTYMNKCANCGHTELAHLMPSAKAEFHKAGFMENAEEVMRWLRKKVVPELPGDMIPEVMDKLAQLDWALRSAQERIERNVAEAEKAWALAAESEKTEAVVHLKEINNHLNELRPQLERLNVNLEYDQQMRAQSK